MDVIAINLVALGVIKNADVPSQAYILDKNVAVS
jgi:hypothetical protein